MNIINTTVFIFINHCRPYMIKYLLQWIKIALCIAECHIFELWLYPLFLYHRLSIINKNPQSLIKVYYTRIYPLSKQICGRKVVTNGVVLT